MTQTAWFIENPCRFDLVHVDESDFPFIHPLLPKNNLLCCVFFCLISNYLILLIPSTWSFLPISFSKASRVAGNFTDLKVQEGQLKSKVTALEVRKTGDFQRGKSEDLMKLEKLRNLFVDEFRTHLDRCIIWIL